jgi:hypothetical protein
MTKDTMIGVDLAKNVFQLHGASMNGDVKFRKKLSRPQFLRFMADHDPAVVVMETCGSANYWAREGIAKLLSITCEALKKAGLCHQCGGVIDPEAERIAAGVAV